MAVIIGGLIPVTVVAAHLGCSCRHVRNLIQRGELEAIRVGRRNFRVVKASMVKFIEKQVFQEEECLTR